MITESSRVPLRRSKPRLADDGGVTIEMAAPADPASVHDAMRHTVTCRAAASEIAQPGFPGHALPRVARLPYVNLGHMVLFDYGLFSRLVWTTVLSLRNLLDAHRNRSHTRLIISAAIVLSTLILVVLLGTNALVISLAVAVGVAIYHSWRSMKERDALNRDARSIRKSAIDQLLRGNVDGLTQHAELNGSWIEWGSGSIGQRAVPVLVASKERPFPGFGQAQNDQLFVTPEARPGAGPEEKALCDLVSDRIVRAITSSGFQDVSVGHVVVVDGNSLRVASPWLSDSSVPTLWIDDKRLDGAMALDPAASVRVYLAVEILFPSHNTLANFFLRVFKVGNAAAVEIHLVTLGPLVSSDRELLQRSLQLEDRPDRKKFDALVNAPTTYYARLLRWWRDRIVGHPDDISSLHIKTDKLKPFDPVEDLEVLHETLDLNGHLAHWIGNWAKLTNWREEHSRTITADYFGITEMRASLRAVYERVVAAALDALNENGFDISTYRDKDGKWQIHADKIDNLVIGEKIAMAAPAETKAGTAAESAKDPAQQRAS